MKKLNRFQISKINEYRNFISALKLQILKLKKEAESVNPDSDQFIKIGAEILVAEGRINSAENQIEYLRSK